MPDRKETYPGGVRFLRSQYQKRRALLTHDEGEELPPLDVDFKEFAQIQLPEQVNPRPDGLSRVAKKRHFLLGELRGQTELAMLHGMLVSHLRKHTYPLEAPTLFLRLWAEEEDWLLTHLTPRWLISAAITFAEHGETKEDRMLGQSLNMLFSVMKLYEAERCFSGQSPQEPFRLRDRNRARLPMGMKDFSIVNGDLEANLFSPLWRASKHAPGVGRLAQRLLVLLNRDDGTVFRRFSMMRDKAQNTN